MKKNISINISGIIFHIEEDGYDALKKYLDSIQKYFSTFDDSSEILADIESRIAEIFLSKLNEEKQVITQEDVNNLIATMGSVSDFQAAEERQAFDKDTTEADANGSETSSEGGSERTYAPPKNLMRDQKRKILGGVCAGLGNYLNVDPLWIRLLFALMFFAYGMSFLIYLVMWIVVPGSYHLEEPTTGKKMFRDPDQKVLGGVAGGVAAYLGIDIVAIRILFVVFTVVGGLGLFLYIVLWIILPEARTVTDRVRMQGEPVTLSNIESTLKRNRTESGRNEGTFAHLILLPFRILGAVLQGIAKVLEPLLDVVRVAIGVVLVIVGLSMISGLVISAGVLAGVLSATNAWWWGWDHAQVPLDTIFQSFPTGTAVASFIAASIPAIFVVLLGLSVVAKRIVFGAAVGWTLFVAFFVSAAVVAATVPRIALSLHEDAVYRTESTFKVDASVAVFRLNEGTTGYRAVHLDLRGHKSDDFRLRYEFEGRGRSRADAIENAKMIAYNVELADSVFTFDSDISFRRDAVFRFQSLEMVMYIPYNRPFMMDESFARFIDNPVYCCGPYDFDDVYRYKWIINEQNELVCLDCPERNDDAGHRSATDWSHVSAGYGDFDEIEITGNFDLTLSVGNEHRVAIGGSEIEREEYNVYRSGRTLIITPKRHRSFDWNDADELDLTKIRVDITLPELQKLEAAGVGTVYFDRFRSNGIDIEGNGPVRLRGKIDADRLNMDLTGAADAHLSGSADRMRARLRFASKLSAYDLTVRDATVEVFGVSSAKVHVTEYLEIEKGFVSEVNYRGNPTVTWND